MGKQIDMLPHFAIDWTVQMARNHRFWAGSYHGRFGPDLSQRNADLALYVRAIAQLADSRDLLLVDLFTDCHAGLTDNGMHISAESQFQVASEISRQLGVPIPISKWK